MFCKCKQIVTLQQRLLTDTKYGPAKSLMTPVEVQIPMWPMNGKSHLKTEPERTGTNMDLMAMTEVLVCETADTLNLDFKRSVAILEVILNQDE